MYDYNGASNINFAIGIVENNTDPTNSGRVQVRWFGIHPPYSTGEVQTIDLPWAFLSQSTNFFSIPNNGDWVFGCFLDGRDSQQPLVLGTINSAKMSLPWNTQSQGLPTDGSFVPKNIGGNSKNAEYAYNYFVSKGFTPQQAAGIVGNLQNESGINLDPTAFNGAGGGAGAQGIAQWRGDRQTAFQNRYNKSILNSTLDEQLDFVMYEFSTTEKNAYNGVKGSSTPSSAAVAFDSLFERNGGATSSIRQGFAETLFGKLGGSTNTSSLTPNDQANPYLAPSNASFKNYGNPPLPPQMTGEDIEYTPIAVHAAFKKEFDGSIPFAGDVNSSIWQANYAGSYIEMHGKDSSEEHINIVHKSGAFITIDSHGNVSIKSMGDKREMSEGNSYEGSEGTKYEQFTEGYSLKVTGGGIDIISEGNMNITSNGDLNITAGGKLKLNSGESFDVAAAKIALSSRDDGIDLRSSTYATIETVGQLNLTSSAKLNMNSGGDIAVDGATINFNSGTSTKEPSITADISSVPSRSASTISPVHSGTRGISLDMTDETT